MLSETRDVGKLVAYELEAKIDAKRFAFYVEINLFLYYMDSIRNRGVRLYLRHVSNSKRAYQAEMPVLFFRFRVRMHAQP